jgi:pSer/pThr/pTyr-binding forkhead associated (FHA) protein
MTRLSSEDAKTLPIFKVWADGGTHPPVALDKPVCVIGRNEVGVNLPLHSPQVSKLHALVVRTQRKVYVRDLASRNGVQRNGAPVQEVGLSDEDVLRIGSYTLRCASGFGHAPDPDPDDTGAGAAAIDAPTLPAAELVATNGLTYEFPSTHQTLLIGSREGCEVRLDDELVAPVHAILFEMDGKRYVRDLGAPGGTYLNDASIHQSELNPGDTLRVGNVTLVYALVDPTQEEAPASLDPIGISDSLMAPSINLGDSVVDPNVVTADSMILPEITMEDSTTPAPAESSKRPASPISEYDFDVAEPDPRRESTFHGEVIADRPMRPELPPIAARDAVGEDDVKADAAQPDVAPTVNDDSRIPMAAPFHDKIIEDHLVHEDDLLEQSRGPMPAVDDVEGTRADVAAPASGDATKDSPDVPADNGAKTVPEKPPEKRATVEAIGPAAEDVDALPPTAAAIVAGVEAPAAPAVSEAQATPAVSEVQSEAAEATITQLVEEVTEQVAHVSEKVELVAAKVERVAAKMSEVTKDVSEVAQTAGELQEVWTVYRSGGEAADHPGTSENSSKGQKDSTDKSNPERVSPAKPMGNAAEAERET